MILEIDVNLTYRLRRETDILLQIEAAPLADQNLIRAHINAVDTTHFARVPADEGIGERIWTRSRDEFRCTYTSKIEINRTAANLGDLDQVAPHLLPGDTVRYLMPSRYCIADEFQNFAAAEFGDLTGGARIAAILDWIYEKFEYVPGASNAQTTALDTFVQRRGVCRDFAHVLITLARASTIPARFASVYAPDVTPQDFHAVAEVYLDGEWHLVDPTRMAKPEEMALIGVGLDAASVAFMNSYGVAELVEQTVAVQRANPA